MSKPILYDYYRSSASYRVRIALNLAGLDYDITPVDLLARAHKTPEHLARNPQGLVPALDIDGEMLTQSLAIIEYLDTTRSLNLLPQDPAARAHCQALAMAIAIDIHPICNTSVAAHATGNQEPARTNWMQHFIRPGLHAFEALLGKWDQTPFCCGDQPTLPDLCLIPQLYNATRWGADFSDMPRITSVAATCADHPAFAAAHPDAVTPG